MTSSRPMSDIRRDARIERIDGRDLASTMARLDKLARLLDSAVRIPGTDVRIGVDALIGIVPVFGDIAAKIISGYLILEARRLGVSRWTLARMATNTTIDTVVGAVPIVGDVFDVMYRANEMNIRLLQRHIETYGASALHRRQGPVIDLAARQVH